MTKHSSFKARIRQRMQKTGERYTTARAQLLSSLTNADRDVRSTAEHYPGILPGYDSFGGIQGETAILRNVFKHAGITHPATGEPYSEAMLHGLCGGIGFMYAVFEYKGELPMLTMVMRSGTLPQTYMMPVFERVGVTLHSSQTTSVKIARQALQDAFNNGTPAICIVDVALLPYYGVPAAMVGMGPHYVAVVGIDGDHAWLDDRSLRPCSITLEQLGKARLGYKAAKQHLLTIESQAPDVDWQASLNDALGATVRALGEGDVGVPAGFRSNCGFAGMEKWRNLLTTKKDKKAWRTVFDSPDKIYVGLRRAYECIQFEYTAPAAGRTFYAEFLEEAFALTNQSSLRDAGNSFRDSAAKWQELAQLIADAPDDSIRRGCEICNRRAELLDNEGSHTVDQLQSLAQEQRSLKDQCTLAGAAAAALFDEMADRLGSIIAIEKNAVEQLQTAISG